MARVSTFLRFGNIIALVVTLVINGLAGTTLLNGRTTAQVSDTYLTLITPAWYVFGIWGIIYFFLFASLSTKLYIAKKRNSTKDKSVYYSFLVAF